MVNKHTSKNGLRIVLEKVPAVRSVTIGIWVLAGSRNETIHTNGISHFIEHMFLRVQKQDQHKILQKHLILSEGKLTHLRLRNILVFTHVYWIHIKSTQ